MRMQIFLKDGWNVDEVQKFESQEDERWGKVTGESLFFPFRQVNRHKKRRVYFPT